MKNYRLHTSEGFKDIYGKELLIKKEIEKRALHSFQSFGFDLIKTPTVEYIDVYSNHGMQKPDLYSLINRQGEVLALCNDMTASIARFVCSNNFNTKNELKFCYSADTFRYPRLYQGKNHQFLQAGVELIGAKGPKIDAEVIYLASAVLKKCNVSDFTIHIGSNEFIEALLVDFNVPSIAIDAIHLCIENKDYVTLKQNLYNNISKENADFIIDLMLKGGRLHYLEALMEKLKNTKSYSVLCSLKETYLLLNNLGVFNILFDFSIYSYAEYYTGIEFSIYVDGISCAVIEGGRCDNLFKSFGCDLPNIGFGLNIDSLTDYTLIYDTILINEKKYLSICDDASFEYAFKMNNELRENNVIVNHISISSLEEAIKYAKENKYNAVIEYKNNEKKIWEVPLC